MAAGAISLKMAALLANLGDIFDANNARAREISASVQVSLMHVGAMCLRLPGLYGFELWLVDGFL